MSRSQLLLGRQGAARAAHTCEAKRNFTAPEDTCSVKTVYKQLSPCHPDTFVRRVILQALEYKTTVNPSLPGSFWGEWNRPGQAVTPKASEELVLIQGRWRTFSLFEHYSKGFIVISEGCMSIKG